MVMKSPREELESLIESIQAQISSIQDDIERALPVPFRKLPRLGGQDLATMLPSEINLVTYTTQARNKLEELRKGVDRLRIRALRGLPR